MKKSRWLCSLSLFERLVWSDDLEEPIPGNLHSFAMIRTYHKTFNVHFLFFFWIGLVTLSKYGMLEL